MRFTALATVACVVLVSGPARAEHIDFDDLPLNSVYAVGDTFTSGPASITGDTYFFGTGGSTDAGTARVRDRGDAGGSGHELWVSNINLHFDFGGGIAELSVRYGEFGGNLNLTLNGELLVFNDFPDIDGASLQGVQIDTTTQPNGVLTLSGPISTFAIGGQELAIDDVIYTVPEPSAALLFGLAGLLSARLIRRP